MDDVPIRNAATVIVVRDGADSAGPLEVLLLQRSAELVFHGGSWVFPGGRFDPEDYAPGRSDDHEWAARAAAVREAAEEASISVSADALVPWAHWTTPPGRPRRFATWFYLAGVGGGASEVTVDGGEISDHLWITPSAALEARDRGDVELPPPTFVSLLRLARYSSVDHALASVPAERYHRFTPRLVNLGEEGQVSIYPGDVLSGTDSDELDRPGPRHRLWMVRPSWRYEELSD